MSLEEIQKIIKLFLTARLDLESRSRRFTEQIGVVLEAFALSKTRCRLFPVTRVANPGGNDTTVVGEAEKNFVSMQDTAVE